MKKIIILRGISNSGKSTWAKQQKDYVVISRDEIRKNILGGDKFLEKYFDNGLDFQLEEYVTKIQEQEIAKNIIKKHNIIIDNTNLKKKYIQEYTNIFADLGVKSFDVEIKNFDISLEEALERNKKRIGKQISEDVIKNQYCSYSSSKFINLEQFYWPLDGSFNMTREIKKWYYTPFDVMPYKTKFKSYVICDLDGTSSHRQILENEGFYMRSFYDYRSAYNDRPDSVVRFMLHSLFDAGIKIIFVSGRKESSRKYTERFIEEKLKFSKEQYKLFMREDEDNRSDDIVKYEIFNKHLRKLPGIFAVFDDRKRVIAMWEELGIKVMNCGALNEEF